ncbi:hypothetical protein JCGZ_00233 [Jatropha curcas]|uniref:Bromo domain-containing protein n=1 Tax=Jatropha curcas TaxID=180498 RepID=A0A067L1T8_JATCU|nr:uncharacterized protein LOC105629655 [Jatropha curcas]KDP42436.1 hypothetical protein JCGZ_00233 [Jatropha curcas]
MKRKRGRPKKSVAKKPKTLANKGEEAFLNFVGQNVQEKSASEHVNDNGFDQFSSDKVSSSSSSSSSSGESDDGLQFGRVNSDSDEPQIDRRVKRTANRRGRTKKLEASKKSLNANVVSSNGLGSSSKKELPPLKIPAQDSMLNKKDLKASLAVIKKVMEMEEAVRFSAPVDPVSQGLPDYFNIIDTPMDFGTICSNLQNGVKYLNSEDVYKDVEYIWENCRKYNKKGEYIVYLMKRVKKKFMKYWTAAGLHSEITKKPSGHSQLAPSGDHAVGYSRHDPMSTVNRPVSNPIQMQQNNFGTSQAQPQPQVPLSSYTQPYHQSQPSTNQVPQFSRFPAGVDADMPRGGGRLGRAQRNHSDGVVNEGSMKEGTDVHAASNLPLPRTPNSDPAANTPVGCTPSSASGPPTPGGDIGSSTTSTTVTGNRRALQVIGEDFDPPDCVRMITRIFKMRFDSAGYNWKSVTADTKNFYWQEFKKHFVWDEAIEASVKRNWNRKAADRYRGMLGKWRKKKPKYLPDNIWESWRPYWETPEFKAKSEQCSKNRLSETGGPGAGPSRHTGGSISYKVHAERLEAQLQRPPLPHELLEATHTRKKDGQFVDQKSKSAYEAILSRVQTESQPQDGSCDPCSVDVAQIYLQEVGGVKKRQVYGLGSQASVLFGRSSASSSFATSRLQNNNIDSRIQEMEQRMKELEMRHQQQQEELQQQVQQQVAKLLRSHLVAMAGGLPAPPTLPSQHPRPQSSGAHQGNDDAANLGRL